MVLQCKLMIVAWYRGVCRHCALPQRILNLLIFLPPLLSPHQLSRFPRWSGRRSTVRPHASENFGHDVLYHVQSVKGIWGIFEDCTDAGTDERCGRRWGREEGAVSELASSQRG